MTHHVNELHPTPRGELTIQTLAMPSHTNPNGDIFGGWLVSQMDLAAGVLAKKTAQGRVATIAIHSMSFFKTCSGRRYSKLPCRITQTRHYLNDHRR